MNSNDNTEHLTRALQRFADEPYCRHPLHLTRWHLRADVPTPVKGRLVDWPPRRQRKPAYADGRLGR